MPGCGLQIAELDRMMLQSRGAPVHAEPTDDDPMSSPRSPDKSPWPSRLLHGAAQVAVVGAGLKYGFDFGHEISGTVMGVVLGINTALCGSMMVSAVVDQIERRLAARRSTTRL